MCSKAWLRKWWLIVIKICLTRIGKFICKAVLIHKTTYKGVNYNGPKIEIKTSLCRTLESPPRMFPWHPGGHTGASEPQQDSRQFQSMEKNPFWRRKHSFRSSKSSGCCAAFRPGWPTDGSTKLGRRAETTGAKCQHGILWFNARVQWDYARQYFIGHMKVTALTEYKYIVFYSSYIIFQSF